MRAPTLQRWVHYGKAGGGYSFAALSRFPQIDPRKHIEIPANASPAHVLYGAADGGVVEAEHIGMMARYRELEHDAVSVERPARHNGDVICAG